MNSNNSTTSTNKKNVKLVLIQSLRGLAALLVVGHHATTLSSKILKHSFLAGVLAFGDSGVDIFFVLSGFIIFYVHQADIGKKDRLKSFAIKRFIRVYPIYFLITIFLLPIYLSGYGDSYKTSIDVILKSFFLYPQDANRYPILNVGWTLSYELLFYILFGLAIFLKPQITRIILSVWTLGIAVTLFADLTNLFSINVTLVNFVFDSRNLEFLFGCLIAYLIKDNKLNFNKKVVNFNFLLAILTFILLVLNKYTFDVYQLPPVITYGIPSIFIVLGAAWRDTNKPVMVPNIFIYLGDASYSIYLTHYFLLSVLMAVDKKLNLASNAIVHHLAVGIMIVIAVGCGCLFFKYVESPLLAFFRKKFATSNAATS